MLLGLAVHTQWMAPASCLCFLYFLFIEAKYAKDF